MVNQTLVNIQDLEEEYNNFILNILSLVLSTIGDRGNPETSYAPFVMDEKSNFYIFVSSLASHYNNLYKDKRAGVMLIEGEEKSENIFARKRAIYDCTVVPIKKESHEWDKIMIKFDKSAGQIMEILRALPDFNLLCLKPFSGKFIKGFGSAYELSGQNMNKLSHINPGKK